MQQLCPKFVAGILVIASALATGSVARANTEPWHDVWSEADLATIGKNTRVSSVSLDAGMVTKLAGHQQITHLRLVNANCLDDTSWAELVRLQNVVHLEVGINEAEPLNMFGQGLRFSGLAGLAFLAKFAKLETLVIYGVPQDEAGEQLAWLKQLPKLKRLELIRCNRVDEEDARGLGTAALATICGLKQLETIHFDSDKATDATIKTLASFPGLKSLSVGWCNLTTASITALASAKQLECLELRCAVTGLGNARLDLLPALKELLLEIGFESDWKPASYEMLRKIKGLKKLTLRTGGMTGLMPMVGQLTQLETLVVEGNYGGSPMHKDQIEAWKLDGLKNLKHLRLCKVATNDDQLASILSISGLETLELVRPFHVTEKGMLGIDKLKSLRRLILERAQHDTWEGTFVPAPWVTKAVIEKIVALENLKELELAGFMVERKDGASVPADQGLSAATADLLASAKSLRYLSLRESSVPIQKLFDLIVKMKGLKHFNAHKNLFEADELWFFKDKRPDLRVSAWAPMG